MFFYASKVIGFLVLPSSFIALGLVGAVYCFNRGQLGRAHRLLIGTLAALLIAGLSPLGDVLTRVLETRFTRPELADASVGIILVLGGAEETSPRELMGLNEAAERITEAAALAHRHPGATVLFSGGSAALVGPHSTGAADARRLFQSLGIAPERIILEDRSRTTWENAVESCKVLGCGLVQPRGLTLLVTSAWHMPRSIGAFRAAGLEVRPWPVDYRAPQGWLWRMGTLPEGLRRIDMIAREYMGLLAYRLTGRSTELLPAPR